MPIKIKNFATLRLSVSDIKKSRDWYRSLFEIEPAEDLENFVSFKMGEIGLDITLADQKSPVSQGGSVGSTIAHAIELGGKIYRGPLRVEEVQRRIVQIQDPFGNVIGFEGEL